ncbi:hypothetical protein RI367_002437 [Sorochytrium milnesiophthora]
MMGMGGSMHSAFSAHIVELAVSLFLDGISLPLAGILLIFSSSLRVFQSFRIMSFTACLAVISFTLLGLVQTVAFPPSVSQQAVPPERDDHIHAPPRLSNRHHHLADVTATLFVASASVYYLHCCTLYWSATRFANMFLCPLTSTSSFFASCKSLPCCAAAAAAALKSATKLVPRPPADLANRRPPRWPAVLLFLAAVTMYSVLLASVIIAVRNQQVYTSTPLFTQVASGIRLAVEVMTKAMMLATDARMISVILRNARRNASLPQVPTVTVDTTKLMLILVTICVSVVNISVRCVALSTNSLLTLTQALSRFSLVVDLCNLMYVGIRRINDTSPSPMVAASPAPTDALPPATTTTTVTNDGNSNLPCFHQYHHPSFSFISTTSASLSAPTSSNTPRFAKSRKPTTANLITTRLSPLFILPANQPLLALPPLPSPSPTSPRHPYTVGGAPRLSPTTASHGSMDVPLLSASDAR